MANEQKPPRTMMRCVLASSHEEWDSGGRSMAETSISARISESTEMKKSCEDMQETDIKMRLIGGEERKGLNLWLASIFIVGQMAGSGVLSLPQGLAITGWSGLILIVVCCINASYGGICLARCWLILEERWEEYRAPNRYPFPNIGYRACGKWMRYCVSVCVDFTVFGAGTVFLLLCAHLIEDMLCKYTGIGVCYWILILAGIQCPLMWLGTPKEFWGAAAAALVSTSVACILILANMAKDSLEHLYPQRTEREVVVTDYFLAFGTIVFAYGGTCAFPTFQNDMKDKSQFPKAIVIGMSLLLLMYLPVCIVAYAVIGGQVKVDIIQSVSDGPLRQIANVLFAGHLFFAFVIVVNPFVQELEEIAKVPNTFNWKRCVLRSMYVMVTAFVAESIPSFGKILDLMGGSTITLLTFVFPPIFYVLLCRQKHLGWTERHISKLEYLLIAEVVIVGVLGGASSTYSAIQAIVNPNAFTPPCYVARNGSCSS